MRLRRVILTFGLSLTALGCGSQDSTSPAPTAGTPARTETGKATPERDATDQSTVKVAQRAEPTPGDRVVPTTTSAKPVTPAPAESTPAVILPDPEDEAGGKTLKLPSAE